MFEQIDAQMRALPTWVQVWTNWMGLITMSSFLWAYWRVEARWAALSVLATMACAMGIFHLFGNVSLFGISHLIFWTPLLIYLLKRVFRDRAVPLKSPFGIWLAALMVTMAISLPFDVYDTIMVLTGNK